MSNITNSILDSSDSSDSSETKDSQLVSFLKREKCIVEGEFKLKSGETSNIYYDIKGIISNPELFRLVCDKLIRILPNNLINYNLIYGINGITHLISLLQTIKVLFIQEIKRKNMVHKD